jgi:hypothetical protein
MLLKVGPQIYGSGDDVADITREESRKLQEEDF